MKMDIFNRSERDANKNHEAPQGLLQVWASQPGALFVTSEGYETLVGYGTEWRVKTTGQVEFRVETKGRVFVLDPKPVNHEPTGEVFTNMDRQPMESGSVLEVTRQLRAMKLEAQAIRRALRDDQAKAERRRQRADLRDDQAKAADQEPPEDEPKGEE